MALRQVAAVVVLALARSRGASAAEGFLQAALDRVAETVTALGHCEGLAQIDFAGARVAHNNLGGLGPDAGEPVIRYAGAGRTTQGTAFDVVVSNRSAYHRDLTGANQGLAVSGRLGELNVASGSRVDLRLSFADSDTGAHLMLNNVIVTFLALGSMRAQSVTACNNHAYYLSNWVAEPDQAGGGGAVGTPVDSKVEVLAHRPQFDCTTFESVPRGDSQDLLVGLDDSHVLSPAQRARSVSLQYNGTSFVDLTLAVGGHPTAGYEPAGNVGPSSFLLAGATPLDGCALVGTSTVTSTTTNTLTTTTPPPTVTVTATTTTTTGLPLHMWDCFTGDADTWVPEKKAWCCDREKLGCPQQVITDGEGAYDCFSDYSHWEEWWPEVQKTWCCEKHQMGCERFNCEDNLADMTVGWSATKQEWCCEHRHVCPPTAAAAPAAGGAFFDCTGSNAEMNAWPADRRSWCCAHNNVGCAAHPFDCKAGVDNWEEDWSAGKKAWCWQHERRGYSLPYNCQLKFDSWEVDWSGNKKAWCCQHQQMGCGFDCGFGNPPAWLEVKKTWCCKVRVVGCEGVVGGMSQVELKDETTQATATSLFAGAANRLKGSALLVGGPGLAAVGLLAAGVLGARRGLAQQENRGPYRVVNPAAAANPTITGDAAQLAAQIHSRPSPRP